MLFRSKAIPQWTLDKHGLAAKLQASPAASDSLKENVTLIPMGAARLRISAFPVIGEGATAHQWIAPTVSKPGKPAYKTSASHCFASDTTDALSDGAIPEKSSDLDIPRLTFWDHRGSAEWVQYDFAAPKKVSEASVYWFDDTGNGQCRVPSSWRLLYQSGDAWQPVQTSASFGLKKDGWNVIEFSPVKTTALRLEVQLQDKFSGGILEWQVK